MRMKSDASKTPNCGAYHIYYPSRVPIKGTSDTEYFSVYVFRNQGPLIPQ